jgi:uncharacterized protein YjbI with pentapeptide repeats
MHNKDLNNHEFTDTDGFLDSSFADCTLSGATFTNTEIFNGNFLNCEMDKASFAGSDLTDTDFTDCDLSGANFIGANLSGVSFGHCDLTEADFSGATICKTYFGNTNLKEADFTHHPEGGRTVVPGSLINNCSHTKSLPDVYNPKRSTQVAIPNDAISANNIEAGASLAGVDLADGTV